MTTPLSLPEEPAVYKSLVKAAVPVARLGQLLTVIRGVTYKKEMARSKPADGFVALLRATNIQQSLGFDELVYVPDSCVSESQLLRAGDILVVASSGSRTVVGKAAPLTHPWRGSFGAFCFALRPNAGVDPTYIAAFLRSPGYRDRVSDLAAGTNINNLRASHIEETPIPLPTTDRQRKIVAYLDEQLSRLDASVAALHRVQANLKRYRASVLKAACEGRLVPTEAELARQQGRDFETGAQLLQRLLAERRARSSRTSKYKEPIAASANEAHELPNGWTRATVEQLTFLVTSGSRSWSAFYEDSGTLFIRAQDIKTDALNIDSVARVNVPADAEGSRSSVDSGDILLTITGANVTKSALVSELSEPAFVSQHVALLKLTFEGTAPFVFNWIVSPANGREILERWAYGAGKPGLSLEQVRELPVALPPLAEQHRIVAEADRRLSLIRAAEAQVAANLARSQRLRQSILQAAFAAPASAGQ